VVSREWLTIVSSRSGRVWVAFAVFSAVFFGTNFSHLAEQEIYRSQLILAGNLLEGHGYVYDPSKPFATYPLWGYPYLLSLTHNQVGLLGVQWLLTVSGAALFYAAFSYRLRWWHLPLLLPYVAVMSVKWPDAPVVFLLLVAVVALTKALASGELKWSALLGVTVGAIGQFRSEYLALVFCAAVTLVVFGHATLKQRVCGAVLACLIQFALLIPWVAAIHGEYGVLRATATNGGAVLYISLGQVPGNPWGITHTDHEATEKVEAIAGRPVSPHSVEGDRLLRGAFTDSVGARPGAFGWKVIHNLASALTGGLYVGEPYTLTVTGNREGEVQRLKAQFGRIGVLQHLLPVERKLYGLYYGLLVGFRLFFFVLVCLAVITSYRRPTLDPAILAILVLLIYKLAVVSLVQYQPRHMNAVYLPLLGLSGLLSVHSLAGIWSVLRPSSISHS